MCTAVRQQAKPYKQMKSDQKSVLKGIFLLEKSVVNLSGYETRPPGYEPSYTHQRRVVKSPILPRENFGRFLLKPQNAQNSPSVIYIVFCYRKAPRVCPAEQSRAEKINLDLLGSHVGNSFISSFRGCTSHRFTVAFRFVLFSSEIS